MDLKKCTNCGLEKPESEFRWFNKLNRHAAKCYQCELAYQREYGRKKRQADGLVVGNSVQRIVNLIAKDGFQNLNKIIIKCMELEMTNLKETKSKVLEWAERTGLDKADPRRQVLKLGEEAGELLAGIARDNQAAVVDAVGDILVVMTILSKQMNIDFDLEDIYKKVTLNVVENGSIDEEMTDVIHFAGLVSLGVARLVKSVADEDIARTHLVNNLEIYLGLFGVCHFYNTTIPAAYASAYDVIKDRKGKMINGVFVKEEDLNDKSL